MKKITAILSFVLAFILILSPSGGLFTYEASAAGKWVSSWATSIVDSSVTLSSLSLQDIIPARSTIRIELKVTMGGDKLRFKFSNEHGAAAITISEATVAKTSGAGNAAIDASTACAITFDGNKSVSVPKGATIWSDAIEYKTQALDSLSVSLYFANSTYITSAGLSNARTFMGLRSIFREDVSQCYEPRINSAREVNIASGTITYHTTPFLAEIDTYVSSGNVDTAVFIGDSTLVNDTYLYFAEKLVNAGVKNVSVVNEAVVANKLLSDGTGLIGNLYGDALIDRFERDALDISGVKYIFVKIGLNDILHQFSKSMGADVPHPSADDIIDGYKTLVKKAHAKGIKIYFFTKSPWKGYEREFLGQTGDVVWTKEMQNMCDELNKWIKTNKLADGYIDCSPLANPADEYALCPSFTPDGAHLTPIAAIALADLIPVSFVGVSDSDIKTAAKIHKVNPYKEKNQIIYDLEHPTEAPREESTTKREENTTRVPSSGSQTEEPTTRVPSSDSQNEETVTRPSSGDVAATVPSYNGSESFTVPVISDTKETQKYNGTGVIPEYNISENHPATIGGGTGVVFMLVLFAVLTVAGAVMFMTLNRKKEEDFE